MSEYMSTLSPSHPDRRSLISCTRCRRLKKKCKQEGRARCQRCHATDQVCRYVDLADDPSFQDGPGSVSPPSSSSTTLIFPNIEPEGSQTRSSPSPPTAMEYSRQTQSREDVDGSAFQLAGSSFPVEAPQSEYSQYDDAMIAQSPSIPNPDSPANGRSISSPPYENSLSYTTPPYATSHQYPQQPPFDTGYPSAHNADVYLSPSSDMHPQMVPLPLSPNENHYNQDITHMSQFREPQLDEQSMNWNDAHLGMSTGMVSSDSIPYFTPQHFGPTDTGGYMPFYGANASGSGYVGSCQPCSMGYYCDAHNPGSNTQYHGLVDTQMLGNEHF